jgi:hypothetical protein
MVEIDGSNSNLLKLENIYRSPVTKEIVYPGLMILMEQKLPDNSNPFRDNSELFWKRWKLISFFLESN